MNTKIRLYTTAEALASLINLRFKFALYHNTGVRYWFRLCELSDSIDEEVNCNA